MTQTLWLKNLHNELLEYLQTLKAPNQPGRFHPCVEGATELGHRVALGFSCLALKTYYTLGLWERLPSEEQEAWIAFMKSFQVDGKCGGDRVTHNAFIDPPVMGYLTAQVPWHRRLIERFFPPKHLTDPQRAIIGETKQAIATLAQIGEMTERPYRGFPTTPGAVETYLARLDWSQPWGAGAHMATLAVFFKSQALRFLAPQETQRLLNACIRFVEGVVDKETGTYFQGPIPEHAILINGAMKVLTALDWLEVPIHYPERLIDTCLERLPSEDGCHLVDAVYVLYRCSQQTQHRKTKIQAYCAQVLDMTKKHHNSDGGFSYNVRRSQTHYYGVPISRGLAESDIHGTCLLAWAVAMLLEILDDNQVGWWVIKP